MSHSVRRARSKFEQFRIRVPEDVQGVVGKAAWTQWLGTTDKVLARQLRAELVARYNAGITSIRDTAARQPRRDALKLLDRAFCPLAFCGGCG